MINSNILEVNKKRYLLFLLQNFCNIDNSLFCVFCNTSRSIIGYKKFNSCHLTGLLCSGDSILSGDENGDLVLRDLITLSTLTSVPLCCIFRRLATMASSTCKLARINQ